MALTRNYDGYGTGAIADQDGMVYTVGYNANGEMANKTTQNLTTPWCISEEKNKCRKKYNRLQKAGEKETIKYDMSMAFNLLLTEVPDNRCTFKTMDEKVATVNEKKQEK